MDGQADGKEEAHGTSSGEQSIQEGTHQETDLLQGKKRQREVDGARQEKGPRTLWARFILLNTDNRNKKEKSLTSFLLRRFLDTRIAMIPVAIL